MRQTRPVPSVSKGVDMSKVKWTSEQQDAIHEKNSNILVAAAAGSGKTAVLVERIINKIINVTLPIAMPMFLKTRIISCKVSIFISSFLILVSMPLNYVPYFLLNL